MAGLLRAAGVSSKYMTTLLALRNLNDTAMSGCMLIAGQLFECDDEDQVARLTVDDGPAKKPSKTELAEARRAEKLAAAAAEAAVEAEVEQQTEAPPETGRGSGVGAWKHYAIGLGLDVPDDATKDDVIALVDEHTGS